MKKQTIKNFGFVPPRIEIADHIFGAVELGAVLKEDGQWDNFLPTYEPQAENYETFGCVVWGTQNALEILHKFLYGKEINADERYNYNCIGIEPPGADPHKGAESIRKDGLTFGLLPITETLEEFRTPRPMEAKYLAQGAKWLEGYSFRHQWVLQGKEGILQRIEAIKDALRYSPLGASVSAWYEKRIPNGQDYIYFDNGQPNNHWVVIYGWNDLGWSVFDSYDHSLKTYAFDSEITYAKRYVLQKLPQKKERWITKIIKSFFTLKYFFQV